MFNMNDFQHQNRRSFEMRRQAEQHRRARDAQRKAERKPTFEMAQKASHDTRSSRSQRLYKWARALSLF